MLRWAIIILLGFLSLKDFNALKSIFGSMFLVNVSSKFPMSISWEVDSVKCVSSILMEKLLSTIRESAGLA